MRKLAFLFSGQGSQYVGMGKALYENFAVAKNVFDEANDVLGFDIANLCFEGDLDVLTQTENTQPAILTMSVAAYQVYMQEIGIKADYMAGHSLGEISALTCAGALKFSDAVRLAKLRGRYMQEAVPVGVGAMAAIGNLDQETVERECRNISKAGHLVGISNYNAPTQFVISGHKAAVDEAMEVLGALEGNVTALKVSAPFHSPLMQSAADRLAADLATCEFGAFETQVLSNVTGLPYLNEAQIIHNLVTQIVKPVQWTESMAYFKKQGIGYAVEMGPGKVLKNLMRRNVSDLQVHSFDNDFDLALLGEAVNNLKHPANAPSLIARSLGIAVSTRNRNWNQDEYQKGVVEPYKRIQQLQEQLEASGQEPTVEQMQQALDMLTSVFQTKQTPVEEQALRFNQLFNETGTRNVFANFPIPQNA